MNKKIVLVGLLLLFPVVSGCGQQAEKSDGKVELKSFDDKVSYVFGVDVGKSLKQTEMSVNLAAFNKGVEDSLNEQKLLLADEEIEAAKQEFGKKRQEEYAKKMKAVSDKNLEESKAYLATNKDKDGVVTTASGLQYEVITQGEGPTPKETDNVSVHYRGTLLDGTEFDSSYKRNQPAKFRVNGVIRGWTEALQLMPVGSKYKLYIPSDLAYGDREVGPDIGPNAMLIFEVELLGIE